MHRRNFWVWKTWLNFHNPWEEFLSQVDHLSHTFETSFFTWWWFIKHFLSKFFKMKAVFPGRLRVEVSKELLIYMKKMTFLLWIKKTYTMNHRQVPQKENFWILELPFFSHLFPIISICLISFAGGKHFSRDVTLKPPNIMLYERKFGIK